jgi:acetate kinase
MTPPHRLPAGSNGSAQPADRVLTMNGGSSSIKFAIFEDGSSPNRNLAGAVERIGLTDTFLRTTGGGYPDEERPLPAADFDQAVSGLLDWLQGVGELGHVLERFPERCSAARKNRIV